MDQDRKDSKDSKESKEPALRFRGFEGEWEERLIDEIAIRSSLNVSDDNLPNVEYQNIIGGTGELNTSIRTLNAKKAGILFQPGDVLYGYLRPYLHNWLLPSFRGVAIGDFWVLQPHQTVSSFLYSLIQSQKFDEIANQSTGTKMPRAEWKLVSQTSFLIPKNLNEQAMIGAYLQHFDQLISLQQQKLNKLEDFKKAMLDKMFPQKGARVPQIRFKGFTGLWEEQKASFPFCFNCRQRLS